MTNEELKKVIRDVNDEVNFWQEVVNKFKDGDSIVSGAWTKTGKSMDYSLSNRKICQENKSCKICPYITLYGKPCLEGGWISFYFNPCIENAENNFKSWLVLLTNLIPKLAKEETYEQIEDLLKTKEDELWKEI